MSAGRTVGRYELRGLLGRGGMGEVYRAYDERLRRHVAIKRLRPREAAGPGEAAGSGVALGSDHQARRARLEREARLVAQLGHPAIVQVFDLVDEEDGEWVVMELIEGCTLASLVRGGPLPVAEAVRYGLTIAAALAAAHLQGIIHRDLKVENVMRTSGGQIKVLDFGLAKRLVSSGEPESAALSAQGQVMGTVRAMSPEQARGLAVDERSDLFSLGVLLYELLAGRSPFVGGTPLDTLVRVSTERQPSLVELPGIGALIPPALSELVDQLLEKAAELRPASAALVESRLRTIAEALPPPGEGEAAAAVAMTAAMAATGEGARRAAGTSGATEPTQSAAHAVPEAIAETGRAAVPIGERATVPLRRSPGSEPLPSPGSGSGSASGSGSGSGSGSASASASEPGSGSASGSGSEPASSSPSSPPPASSPPLSSPPRRAARLAAILVASALGLALVWSAVRRSRGGDAAAPPATSAAPASSSAPLAAPPRDPRAAYERGMALLTTFHRPGALDEAAAIFQQLLRADEASAAAYAGLARVAWHRYVFTDATRDAMFLQQAAAAADRAVALDELLADARVSRGLVRLERGEVAAAEEDFQLALTLDAGNADAHDGLARVREHQQRWAEAEAAYRKAIELAPQARHLYDDLGALQLQRGEIAQAIALFEQSIALAPDSPYGYSNLGAVHLLQGRYPEAAERFQDALKIRPSASLYSNLGTVLFAQGLYAPAASAFERALTMGGAANHHVFWGNLADAYRQLPDAAAKAREHYDRAIALVEGELVRSPDDATLQSRRALYLAKRGDCPRAVSAVAALDGAASLTAYTHFRIAVARELCGARAAAIAALGRALAEGFSAAEIANDPELRRLRADPAYHQMLQRREALSRPATRR